MANTRKLFVGAPPPRRVRCERSRRCSNPERAMNAISAPVTARRVKEHLDQFPGPTSESPSPKFLGISCDSINFGRRLIGQQGVLGFILTRIHFDKRRNAFEYI